MKFTVGKDPLMSALQKASAAVGIRTSISVLSNLLFTAEGGKVHIMSTDLDLSVRATIPATIEREGATTLPAKIVPSIVRDAPSAELNFERLENETTSISAGSAVFMLRGISADDFPPFPSAVEARALTVDQKVLKTMLQRVGYAASTDESRRVLNGTLLRIKEGRLTAVATDGRRLALVEQDLESVVEESFDVILPTKAVNELVRSLGDEGTMWVRVMPSQAIFETDNLQIRTKLIEGVYPNFAQVIPSQAAMRITIERELFMNALRRVSLLTSEKSNTVRLNFGKNRVEITASSVDVGDARETVPVKYEGDEITIAFNPTLLIDPLKYLVSDEVTLEISNPTSPGVIRTDEPFLYVIMPLMIS